MFRLLSNVGTFQCLCYVTGYHSTPLYRSFFYTSQPAYGRSSASRNSRILQRRGKDQESEHLGLGLQNPHTHNRLTIKDGAPSYYKHDEELGEHLITSESECEEFGLPDPAIDLSVDKFQAQETELEHIRELLQMSRFIRRKTLAKKYFREEKKPNLLTWAAKEQMKSLHRNNPQEWTVLKLASCFPVSEKSITKILKSHIPLRRSEDILRHDYCVVKNWEKIVNSIDNDKSPVAEAVFKSFYNSAGKLKSLSNAVGLKEHHLPQVVQDFSPPGPFSTIVRDSLDSEKEVAVALSKQIDDLSERIASLLCNFTLKLPEEEEACNAKVVISDKERNPVKADSKKKNHPKFFRDSDSDEVKLNKRNGEQISYLPKTQSQLQGTRKDGSLYRQGDCVYDDNNVFLYRMV